MYERNKNSSLHYAVYSSALILGAIEPMPSSRYLSSTMQNVIGPIRISQ